MRNSIILILLLSSLFGFSQSQTFTKEDTLFGSNHALRSWWEVVMYNIAVKPDFETKTISGYTEICYVKASDTESSFMQLDLQDPMKIDSIYFLDYSRKKIHVDFKKENNRWIVTLPKYQPFSSLKNLLVYFSGKPHEAKNPPWDGGWVWKKDSLGNPWMSVACQGIGASVWFPCKDLQSSKTNKNQILTRSMIMDIIVPDTLVGIGNGSSDIRKSGNFEGYGWETHNPISTYNIVPYIGKYTLVHDSIQGEKGKLITDYWVLDYHKNKVETHLKPNVTKTLKCFEYWFGPYPFYEDSYKIVEAPYLGMEHQSNVAYGNHFMNGYLGRDLSNTGWGLKWDFIVVHESGHEWFGNNITASDVADNWIHEGFTSYAEVLFTECEFGKEAGNDYCEGVKKSISNDIPIIGQYGVHKEGSGDMYNKGSQVVHMIRQVVNDDEKFRSLLRAMNSNLLSQNCFY
jgi:aminopeptidase N